MFSIEPPKGLSRQLTLHAPRQDAEAKFHAANRCSALTICAGV